MRREPKAFLVRFFRGQCEGVDQENLDEMMVHFLVLECVQAILQQFDAAIMIPPDQPSFFHALERAVDRAMTNIKLLGKISRHDGCFMFTQKMHENPVFQ